VYALTLVVTLGACCAWHLWGRVAMRILGTLSVFLLFFFVFGIPSLAGWHVYKRALNRDPTPDTAHPPHRQQTF